MTIYGYEHELHEHFRALAARDRQLTRSGWFWRHDHRPPNAGWRVRVGKGLIRLGYWLQQQGDARPTRTSRV